jgi:plastocyanin
MLAPTARSPFLLIAAATVVAAAAIVLGIVAPSPLSPLFGGGRAEAVTVTVRVGDNWFCDQGKPDLCLQGASNITQVNVGDTVVWQWVGSGIINHSTADCNGVFQAFPSPACSGPLGGVWQSLVMTSGSFSRTFGPADAGKTFNYLCTIHPTIMQGAITVQAAATPTPTPTPTPIPPPTPTPGPGDDTDGDTIPNSADADDDGDGYLDDDETGKGSDPFNPASTPEHADGIDNDGDTTIDEEPTGANWDIDADTVKDSLDADVDTDGDGAVNTLDGDDDGDGVSDGLEQGMSTDELSSCPTNPSHDASPSDFDHDGDADPGDLLGLFFFSINQQVGEPLYSKRSDFDGDDDDDPGDILGFFFFFINTKCQVITFTNNTSGDVDDIHIEWSGAIAEVLSALDSDLEGWPNRTIGGGGLTLDIDRPDGQGDLANGGQLTIVVRGTNPVISSCQWTLDGVNKGAC